MGLLIFYNGPTCLCLNSTMSTYDYVYLILEAMSSMTLLSQYLHIHFQFIFILFISSNFKLYLFLKTNEIYLFSNIEERLFTFLFLPLRPILISLVHIEWHNFVIFHPFLLPLVALCSLSVPDHSSMFLFTFYQLLHIELSKVLVLSLSPPLFIDSPDHLESPTHLYLVVCFPRAS